MAHLLASEGLEGEHCLMIGDRKHDIRAARRNGARIDRRVMGLRLGSELEAPARKAVRGTRGISRGLTDSGGEFLIGIGTAVLDRLDARASSTMTDAVVSAGNELPALVEALEQRHAGQHFLGSRCACTPACRCR